MDTDKEVEMSQLLSMRPPFDHGYHAGYHKQEKKNRFEEEAYLAYERGYALGKEERVFHDNSKHGKVTNAKPNAKNSTEVGLPTNPAFRIRSRLPSGL